MPFTVGLAAHEISCERGGRTLFQGLSFALRPGEALLVTGPNGAGKTSLLRQLAELLPLSAGRLETPGAEADMPLAELCHYVGHLNAAKTALSVRENLAFWTEYLGESGGDLAAALAAFELEALAHLPAGLLSAGQRRKLALSRLLVAPRPIWLLDEPSVSLDTASVKRLGEVVDQHLRQGGIAVVASHVPLKTTFARKLALALEHAS